MIALGIRVEKLFYYMMILIPVCVCYGENLSGDVYLPDTRIISCDNADTLPELIQCIRTYLPPRGTDSYIEPDPLLFEDWRQMIGQMLTSDCSSIQLPPGFVGFYEIRSFTDNQNGRTYCVLMETGDVDQDDMVDHGWGTYIVDPAYEHDLIIHVPHPREDLDTEQQGLRVFREIRARVFMMAGTSPDASTTASLCQPEFPLSDMCHNLETMFQNTLMQILQEYQVSGADFLAIQFHGMSDAMCPGVDVFMTHGTEAPPFPKDPVNRLKLAMEVQHPDWVIRVPGEEPPCHYYGSTNIQGRVCNGVPYELACTTFASTWSRHFIHIESKPLMRESEDWFEAIEQVMSYQPVPATGWLSVVILLVVLGSIVNGRRR